MIKNIDKPWGDMSSEVLQVSNLLELLVCETYKTPGIVYRNWEMTSNSEDVKLKDWNWILLGELLQDEMKDLADARPHEGSKFSVKK